MSNNPEEEPTTSTLTNITTPLSTQQQQSEQLSIQELYHEVLFTQIQVQFPHQPQESLVERQQQLQQLQQLLQLKLQLQRQQCPPPELAPPHLLHHYDNPTFPARGLPTELWSLILSYLYPSEMIVVSRVCRAWRSLIFSHSVWNIICTTANLPLLPIGAAVNLEGSRSGFLHFKTVWTSARQVCERCFKGCPADNLAWRLRSLPIPANTSGDLVWMCRPCRVDMGRRYPQPMPSFRAAFEFEDYLIQPRIETSVALHNYRLKGPQIRTLCNGDGYDFTKQGSPRTFLAEDVVRLSRQIHGGDIGVAALRKHINPGNTAREMHNCGLVVAEPIYTADWAMSDIRLLAARALVAYKHRIPTDLGESVAIFKMYVETDLSCIRTVIDEFELVDWLHRCADWAHPYPSKEKIRLSQLIPFDGTPVTLEMAQIAVETMELTLMSTEEERKEDEKRMQALSRWTWGRVRGVLEESTLLTPHDPDWPPEVVWRMMESLMGAETVHSIKQEAEARGPTDA